MGFFNDLGKKTSQTTTKIAKETKLRLKITDNKGKIKSIYEEIGKKAYQCHIREEKINLKEMIEPECSQIDDLSKEIDEAKKEILILNHKKACKKCFAEIDETAQFCPQCGEKQTEEKTVLEKTEEKLEKADISSERKKEAKDVKENLKEKNKKK